MARNAVFVIVFDVVGFPEFFSVAGRVGDDDDQFGVVFAPVQREALFEPACEVFGQVVAAVAAHCHYEAGDFVDVVGEVEHFVFADFVHVAKSAKAEIYVAKWKVVFYVVVNFLQVVFY